MILIKLVGYIRLAQPSNRFARLNRQIGFLLKLTGAYAGRQELWEWHDAKQLAVRRLNQDKVANFQISWSY